ncbi:hypothetical protein NMY22_g1496 [Coprinellus aureogranulatus]|nr:hypothetical protein NMY22_g1496 [Coprinellus aureogranulatus]
MTEYDYSPAAVEAWRRKQDRISKWASNTSLHKHPTINPQRRYTVLTDLPVPLDPHHPSEDSDMQEEEEVVEGGIQGEVVTLEGEGTSLDTSQQVRHPQPSSYQDGMVSVGCTTHPMPRHLATPHQRVIINLARNPIEGGRSRALLQHPPIPILNPPRLSSVITRTERASNVVNVQPHATSPSPLIQPRPQYYRSSSWQQPQRSSSLPMAYPPAQAYASPPPYGGQPIVIVDAPRRKSSKLRKGRY